MTKKLKSGYQELADEFEDKYADSGCHCFQAPPCGFCTHPGNPFNLEENEDAWEDEEVITVWDTATKNCGVIDE